MATNDWSQYSIFISSTFIDMDNERDIIKFNVINRLNSKYNSRKISFQAIDLRAGINTELMSEHMREDKVLDICFNSIDAARPFFIGLLGERYGWIPSEEKRNSVLKRIPQERKALLQDCGDVSVTEMEILYGAVGNDGENIDHSLFFYRNPGSYSGMKEEQLNSYRDMYKGNVSVELELKKRKLREKIKQVLSRHSSEDQWIEYTLKYNPETDSFEGLEDFAELVYRHIVEIVDKEIHIIGPENPCWWKREREINEYIAERNVAGTLERMLQVPEKCTFIYGNRNSGKSILLSQIYRNTKKEKHIAFIGMTSYGRDLRSILVRWMCEMEAMSFDKDVPDREELTDIDLYRRFQETASARDIVFFLDDIDALSGEDRLLGWLKKNFVIYMTGDELVLRQLIPIHDFIVPFHIPELTENEKSAIISNAELQAYFELPKDIRKDLISRNIDAGDIGLAMKLVTGLSSKDFMAIRQAGGQIEEINNYLRKIYDESNSSVIDRFYYTVSRFAINVCNNVHIVNALDYIALSRTGLRECDIENIMADKWDPVSFAMLTNYFADYFIVDPYTKKFNVKSTSMAADIKECVDNERVYSDLAACIMRYEDSDSMKRDILLYYIIKAHCPEGGIEYLSSRKHFRSYEDISEWYRMAVTLLKSDGTVTDDIKECCDKMNDGEKAVFLYHFLNYGIKFGYDMKLYIQIMETCASDISTDLMTENQAFATGWLFTDASLYLKHNKSFEYNDTDYRLKFIDKGLAGFQKATELNPDNEKAHNMITAITAELIDVYLEMGDFDKVMELSEKYVNK